MTWDCGAGRDHDQVVSDTACGPPDAPTSPTDQDERIDRPHGLQQRRHATARHDFDPAAHSAQLLCRTRGILQPAKARSESRRPASDRKSWRDHHWEKNVHKCDGVCGADPRVTDGIRQELWLDAGVRNDDQDVIPHVPTCAGHVIMTRSFASVTMRRTIWSSTTRRNAVRFRSVAAAESPASRGEWPPATIELAGSRSPHPRIATSPYPEIDRRTHPRLPRHEQPRGVPSLLAAGRRSCARPEREVRNRPSLLDRTPTPNKLTRRASQPSHDHTRLHHNCVKTTSPYRHGCTAVTATGDTHTPRIRLVGCAASRSAATSTGVSIVSGDRNSTAT